MKSIVTEKYLNKLDKLIATGNEICNKNERRRGQWVGHTGIDGYHKYGSDEVHTVHLDFDKWKFSLVNLLDNILPKEHPHRTYIQFIRSLGSNVTVIKRAIQLLQSIRDDFSEGFLNDIIRQIEMEISTDYMAQAESLIKETQRESLNYVPAAVLAGAVLEKRLKKLCLEQIPAIPLVLNNSKPKTLNSLVEDLKNTELFPETKAKELRFWADIRNNAAHGDFEKFTRNDVERMISGINIFLNEKN